ncbi:hypothetical protein DFQ28_009719 [Apophysomyces sp. BC1034]|nr:hypothetical protein DFQ30_011043 [Apophysomyces sp. BC1015]KAG0172468.1 hypothetical protein DFQ29_008359 [Apophysomyces sp. BC1021]KAG0185199.1 hypothetical protein DFQ28_009719 [Apophysomyces sp. BC1034]
MDLVNISQYLNVEETLKRSDLKSSVGVAAAVLLTAFTVRRALSKRDNISIVPYTFPFIGSTFTYVKDPSKFVQEVTEKYGNVFRVNLFGQMVTVVGADNAHEVFTHPDMSFLASQRKFLDFGLMLDFSDYQLPHNALGSAILKHLTPNLNLYSPRGFNQYLEIADTVFGNATEPVVLPNFLPYIQSLIGRSSAAAFVGLELCKDNDLMHTFEKVVTEVSAEIFPGPFRAIFPWFNTLYMRVVYPRLTAIKRHRANIRKAIEPEIRKRLARMKENADSKMPEDMLQYMIQTYPGELTDAYFESLTTWLISMIFVGVHTTTEATTHVVYQLVVHHECIEELLEEQEEVLREEAAARGIIYDPTKASDDGLFSPEVYKKLVKLDSFIRETFRARSRGFNHAHTHTGKKDIVLRSGAVIHPGEEVYINMWHVHHDEKTQKAANEDIYNFHPYRYVGLGKQATKIGDDFVTFGLGRHACPGRWFAIQQAKGIMSFLIRHYNIAAEGPIERPDVGNNLRNPKGKVWIEKKK